MCRRTDRCGSRESQTSDEVLPPIGGGGGSRRLLVFSLQYTAQSVSLNLNFTSLSKFIIFNLNTI